MRAAKAINSSVVFVLRSLLAAPAVMVVPMVVPTVIPVLIPALINEAHAQTPIEVSQADGLLSVRASNAQAADLAAALTEETGIHFVVTGATDAAITAEIVDEPFEKAVAKLSPNHMLVRKDATVDAEVVEVVLMMDDSQGSGGNTAEFLPSGAPADEVIVENPVTNADGTAMTDTARSMLQRPDPYPAPADGTAAAGPSMANGEIDPATGLPVNDVNASQSGGHGDGGSGHVMSMPPADDPPVPPATQ